MGRTSCWDERLDDRLLRLRNVDRLRFDEIAAVLRAPATSCRRRYRKLMYPDPAEEITIVPTECLLERDYRFSLLPASITAWLFGDPLPGYSALDRKDPEGLSRRLAQFAIEVETLSLLERFGGRP